MSKLLWETNLDIASLGLPDFETDQELAHEHISHLSASSKACLELMGWKGALTLCETHTKMNMCALKLCIAKRKISWNGGVFGDKLT